MLRFGASPREGGLLAFLERLLGINRSEQLDERGGHPSPSGLMTRTEPSAVVSMEILVEQDVVTPVRIGLKESGPAVHRTPALCVTEEDSRQPICDLPGHFEQVHHAARARRALDPERVTVIKIEVQERANDQQVDR